MPAEEARHRTGTPQRPLNFSTTRGRPAEDRTEGRVAPPQHTDVFVGKPHGSEPLCASVHRFGVGLSRCEGESGCDGGELWQRPVFPLSDGVTVIQGWPHSGPGLEPGPGRSSTMPTPHVVPHNGDARVAPLDLPDLVLREMQAPQRLYRRGIHVLLWCTEKGGHPGQSAPRGGNPSSAGQRQQHRRLQCRRCGRECCGVLPLPSLSHRPGTGRHRSFGHDGLWCAEFGAGGELEVQHLGLGSRLASECPGPPGTPPGRA